MKTSWFKRKGLLFIPVSFAAWILLITGVAFAVYRFISIDSQSHSVSDTLINFVFSLLLIVAAYSLIGYFMSRPHENP